MRSGWRGASGAKGFRGLEKCGLLESFLKQQRLRAGGLKRVLVCTRCRQL